jgi:hypothetical protein
MNSKYIIVLFKNKKKRKIIKRYTTEKNAKSFFNSLVEKQNQIIFPKIIENAEETSYTLGLLTNTTNIQKSLHIKDDFGRNIPASIENSSYVFLDLVGYKQEEKIFDWQTKDKITFLEFIKLYCDNTELKNIFTLNNKICVQKDTELYAFSLKDKNESVRFLDTLQDYFFSNNRMDGLFVKDISTTQRKWIYNVLTEKGFDKKRLYRLKTTFSKR